MHALSPVRHGLGGIGAITYLEFMRSWLPVVRVRSSVLLSTRSVLFNRICSADAIAGTNKIDISNPQKVSDRFMASSLVKS
jgi:hypothetical protein